MWSKQKSAYTVVRPVFICGNIIKDNKPALLMFSFDKSYARRHVSEKAHQVRVLCDFSPPVDAVFISATDTGLFLTELINSRETIAL